jgi:drug/metabolite transporter (DMT)-like permease
MISNGIILAIFSGILVGVSIFLQKMGSNDSSSLVKQLISPKWILGVGIAIVSFVFYLWALSMERISLVQPIINISLIVLIFLEYFIMKIKLNIHSKIAIILFFIGVFFQVGII